MLDTLTRPLDSVFIKKFWSTRMRYNPKTILPRENGGVMHAAIGIDTSGGISPVTTGSFIRDISAVCSPLKNFKLLLFAWDTEVHNPIVITQDNRGDLRDYRLEGGGGTSARCASRYLMSPTCPVQNIGRLIMLTDGNVFDWGDQVIDTLWVFHSNPLVSPPPFGMAQYQFCA